MYGIIMFLLFIAIIWWCEIKGYLFQGNQMAVMFITMIICLLYFILSVIFTKTSYNVIYEKHNLIAINTNTSPNIKGEFFLGCGNINSNDNLKYYYIECADSNSYVTKSININTATIYYISNDSVPFVQYNHIIKSHISNNWFYCILPDKEIIENYKSVYFGIPKRSSILQNYNVNLK